MKFNKFNQMAYKQFPIELYNLENVNRWWSNEFTTSKEKFRI